MCFLVEEETNSCSLQYYLQYYHNIKREHHKKKNILDLIIAVKAILVTFVI